MVVLGGGAVSYERGTSELQGHVVFFQNLAAKISTHMLCVYRVWLARLEGKYVHTCFTITSHTADYKRHFFNDTAASNSQALRSTKGPSRGYPRRRFWDLGTVLEPFCGEQSPKVNKPVKN